MSRKNIDWEKRFILLMLTSIIIFVILGGIISSYQISLSKIPPMADTAYDSYVESASFLADELAWTRQYFEYQPINKTSALALQHLTTIKNMAILSSHIATFLNLIDPAKASQLRTASLNLEKFYGELKAIYIKDPQKASTIISTNNELLVKIEDNLRSLSSYSTLEDIPESRLDNLVELTTQLLHNTS